MTVGRPFLCESQQVGGAMATDEFERFQRELRNQQQHSTQRFSNLFSQFPPVGEGAVRGVSVLPEDGATGQMNNVPGNGGIQNPNNGFVNGEARGANTVPQNMQTCDTVEAMLHERTPRPNMHGNNSNNAYSEAPNQQMTQMLHLMSQLLQQNISVLQQSAAAAAQPSYHVMPDLSKTIGEFNGRDGPIEARQWLDHVETSARLHQWPEAFLYETASSHLRDAARSWFITKRSEFRSWNDFRTAFKKTFVPQLNKTDLWNQMRYRKQQAGESVADYFHDKVRRCKSLGLTFPEIKEQVAAGLNSRETTMHVLSTMQSDEDEEYLTRSYTERRSSGLGGGTYTSPCNHQLCQCKVWQTTTYTAST